MGALSPAGFIFRDAVEYILPTVLLLALFSPYFYQLDALSFVGLAVVLGYLTSWFQGKVASIYKKFGSVKAVKEQHMWHEKNWDYDKLFLELGHRDREYLYLTQAYGNFYMIVSFYLVSYFAANAGVVLVRMLQSEHTWGSLVAAYVSTSTPMIGGFTLPTWIVLVSSLVGATVCYEECSSEIRTLFTYQYPMFARKYHELRGGLAKAVWGRIKKKDSGEPVAGVSVTVYHPETGKVVGQPTRTDESCRYQIFDIPYLNSPYIIEIVHGGNRINVEQKFAEKSIEYDKTILV